MRIIIYDADTRSTLNLRMVGSFVYLSDPSTDVWCVSYCIIHDDTRGSISTWRPGELSFQPLTSGRFSPGASSIVWSSTPFVNNTLDPGDDQLQIRRDGFAGALVQPLRIIREHDAITFYRSPWPKLFLLPLDIFDVAVLDLLNQTLLRMPATPTRQPAPALLIDRLGELCAGK